MFIKPSINPDYGEIVFTENEVKGADTNVIGAQSIYEEFAENPFFPEANLNNYLIQGNEEITVAAGTFNCTVVIGINQQGIKLKYWMIKDMSGIYARMIKQQGEKDLTLNILYMNCTLLINRP